MASSAVPNSESLLNYSSEVDPVLEDVLRNLNKDIGSEMSSSVVKEMENATPSASVRNAFDNLTQDYDSILGTGDKDICLTSLSREQTPLNKFVHGVNVDTDPRNASSFQSFTEKESCNASETNLDWVNFHFDRLMSGTGRASKPKTESGMGEALSGIFDSNADPPRSKNVEEIMKYYSSDLLSATNCSSNTSVPPTCRVSNAWTDPLKSGIMNVSQNNEALDASNTETDQLRRIGSSVDADFGDSLRLRSKLSVTSSTQMSVNDEVKKVPSDSDVDFQPSTAEARNEIQGLNYSFHKERSRLRHIESLIRKTPASTSTGMNNYQSWRSQNFGSGYTSKYSSGLGSDISGRTYSSTDYRYSTPDWRSSSTEKNSDFLNRTMSTPSYVNYGQYPSKQGSSYRRDYSPLNLGSGYKRSPSSSPTPHSFHDGPSTVFTNATSHSTALNRSVRKGTAPKTKQTSRHHQYSSVKKDKNMSRTINERQPVKQKSAPVKPGQSKSLAFELRRYDRQDKAGEHRDYNVSRTTESEDSDRCLSSHSSSHLKNLDRLTSTESQSKHCPSKYQQYNPIIPQQYQPNANGAKTDIFTYVMQKANDVRFEDRAGHSGEVPKYKEPWSKSYNPAATPFHEMNTRKSVTICENQAAAAAGTRRSLGGKKSGGVPRSTSESWDCRYGNIPQVWTDDLQEPMPDKTYDEVHSAPCQDAPRSHVDGTKPIKNTGPKAKVKATKKTTTSAKRPTKPKKIVKRSLR